MQACVPGAERSRRSTACDACFRRKIKCDSAQPQCNWCYHRQADCTYARHRSAVNVHKKSSTSQKRNLIDRIRYIDQLRAESGRQGDPPVVEEKTHAACQAHDLYQLTGPTYLRPSSRIIHFAGWKIVDISVENTTTPSFLPEGVQWVQSKTGATVPFPKAHHAPWEKSRITPNPLGKSPQFPTRRLELPPKAVLDRYLGAYWSSAIHAIFPVINSALFSQTINVAYSVGESDACQSSRACIFALLALISGVDFPRAYCNVPLPPNVPRDAYILEAQSLLPSIICEASTLDALQTTVIMAIVGVMTGELQSSTHYISISSRCIIAAGIHTMGDPVPIPENTYADLSELRIKKHLRNLFWLCYSLDKDLSLRTGQSHCLHDEDCNLQLPSEYTANLSRMAYSAAPRPTDGPLFFQELRLSLIKSRIFTALYSHQGLQTSDSEVIRLIRELDNELEQWRLSMPPDLRPILTYGKDAFKQLSAMTMSIVTMHLNYYFCVNIVYLAGSRCDSWRSTCSSPGIIDGLRSSQTMSVAASRSLMLFLQDAENSISTGSFWSLLFYPMAAVLTIFSNLLENPTAVTAADDVYILTMTKCVIERAFLRQISEIDQAAHLQAITSFISRLRDIAQQAVQKAINHN
ncbi:transcription factor domain-containing protein [Aspergillus undulatus]|uniref:transcription factor domain-containing protein n=1 Tax=Aspergillus undulatus TaxID=1810928 RepID=UPI003CCCDB14